MPRQIRFMVLIGIVLLVTLACNAVTQPLNQAQQVVETAQSLATAMPVETLMAIPSVLPTELSGYDATDMPYNMDCFSPKSDPLEEWQGIPIMPDAKAGDECADLYVFTVAGTLEDIQAYYDETLATLGWQTFPGMDSSSGVEGLFLIYQKDNEMLSIVVTPSTQGDDLLMVMLTKS